MKADLRAGLSINKINNKSRWPIRCQKKKKMKKQKNLIACRGLGRVVGPLLAARALPLRCAASTMLSSTLLAI
jgi:hypothetical protein